MSPEPSPGPSAPLSSVPWRDRIVEALGAIGAEDAAESSIKYIQRQEYKENKWVGRAVGGGRGVRMTRSCASMKVVEGFLLGIDG